MFYPRGFLLVYVIHGKDFVLLFFFGDNLRFYSQKKKINKKKNNQGYIGEPRTKACSELITSERTTGVEPKYKTIS